MATTTAFTPRTVDKQHFEAFNVGYLSFQTTFEQIFQVRGSDRKTSEYELIAGGTNLEEVAEDAAFPETNVKEIGNKFITVRSFKKQIELTTLLERTAIAKTINQARNLGARARIRKDQIAASVFQNAFITTNGFDININGTATPLVGTTQGIGDTGNTQSNQISGALSKATLSEAVTQLALQKDHDGELTNFTAMMLLVGATLNPTARELVDSRSDVDVQKNEGVININEGINMITWNQIEVPFGFAFDPNNDTNAELKDNWFLWGNVMDNPFQFLNVVPTMFEVTRDPVTGSRLYQAEFAADAKAVNYTGVVGSDGT